MQFIKVHIDPIGHLYRVNVNHILYYSKTPHGSEITFDVERSPGVPEFMMVTETPEEIEKMILN